MNSKREIYIYIAQVLHLSMNAKPHRVSTASQHELSKSKPHRASTASHLSMNSKSKPHRASAASQHEL